MITVAVLTVLLGMTVLALRREYQGLTAVNQSGQVISRMVVNAGGEQSVITDLADGAMATVPFPVHDDQGFKVAGTLKDGTKFSGGFKITGNPKRFARLAVTIEENGQVRLSLDRFAAFR